MASISREKNGRRTIQFIGADSKRRSIWLGKTSQRQAEAVKVRVEHLAAATISGHPPDAETSRWVANLDRVLAEKIAAAGLIAKRESITLAAFIGDHIVSRHDVKPATVSHYEQTKTSLVAFFGELKHWKNASSWRSRERNTSSRDIG